MKELLKTCKQYVAHLATALIAIIIFTVCAINFVMALITLFIFIGASLDTQEGKVPSFKTTISQ